MLNEKMKEMITESGLNLDTNVLENLSEMIETRASEMVTEKHGNMKAELDTVIAEREIVLQEKYDEKIKDAYQSLVEKADEYQTNLAEKMVKFMDKTIEEIHEANKFEYQNEEAVNQSLIVLKNEREKLKAFAIDESDLKKGTTNVELKEKYTKSIEKSIKLENENNQLKKDMIISEKCKSLAESQIESVKQLTEDIEFNDNFGSKVETFVKALKGEKVTVKKLDNGLQVESETDNDEITLKEDHKSYKWYN